MNTNLCLRHFTEGKTLKHVDEHLKAYYWFSKWGEGQTVVSLTRDVWKSLALSQSRGIILSHTWHVKGAVQINKPTGNNGGWAILLLLPVMYIFIINNIELQFCMCTTTDACCLCIWSNESKKCSWLALQFPPLSNNPNPKSFLLD